MAKAAPLPLQPQWTERDDKSGLDPLGMQISSVGLYQSLLPGISNVSLRIRYYGYFAWLCHLYAQRVGKTDTSEWQKYVRRAEALYALVSTRKGNEPGVAGVTWASKALSAIKGNSIHFAQAADPGSKIRYLNQAWGAYGAAYSSQLYEVGIYNESGDHELPVVSSEIGQHIAKAFSESLEGLGEELFEIIESGTVSLEQLDTLAIMTPSAIPPSGNERDHYEDLLFARASGARQSDLSRKSTLLLILEYAAAAQKTPTVDDLRWTFYKEASRGAKFDEQSATALIRQKLLWSVYQSNDLTHIAYASLLKYFLDLLSAYPAGVNAFAIIDEAVNSIIGNAEKLPHSWRQFVSNFEGSAGDDEILLSKELLTRVGQRVFDPGDAWRALQLLALVYNRSKEHAPIIGEAFRQFNPLSFRSIYSEAKFLDEICECKFSEFLRQLLDRRILQRHLWIALKKLRQQGDYTFLVEMDDELIRLRKPDGPVLTNPRLGPAINFLKDIGLIDKSGITVRGKQVLVRA